MGILTELMIESLILADAIAKGSTLRNLFEIAIISFLVYEILFWIKKYKGMDLTEGTFNDHGICHCGGPFTSGYHCLDP